MARLNASLLDVINSVRAQGLEGVVAKSRNSAYESGRRTGAWRKMRLNQGHEFVIGGYTTGPNGFDAIIFGITLKEGFYTQGGLAPGLQRC